MNRLFSNVTRLFKNPWMALQYLRWICAKVLLGRPAQSSFFGGVRFGGFVSFSEYWLRHRGLDTEDLLTLQAVMKLSSLRPKAIDIGANLGLFSLAMAKVGFSEIHSFEPIPATHLKFLKNIELNSEFSERILPRRLGVGAKQGNVKFMVNPTSPGQNKIATPSLDVPGKHCEVSCEITTLDTYLKESDIGQISLLKMDVEGFEADVLKGGSECLKSGQVDFIYSEVIEQALIDSGSSLNEFADLIASSGFTPVLLESNGFSKVTFDEAIRAAGCRRNILFQFTANQEA